jgi:hypothetical protein
VCDLILRRLEPCGDNSSCYAALPTSAPGEPRASEAKLSLRNTRDNVCSIPPPYKRTSRVTSIRKVSTTAHLVLIPSRHRAGHRSGRGLRTAQVPPYRRMVEIACFKGTTTSTTLCVFRSQLACRSLRHWLIPQQSAPAACRYRSTSDRAICNPPFNPASKRSPSLAHRRQYCFLFIFIEA